MTEVILFQTHINMSIMPEKRHLTPKSSLIGCFVASSHDLHLPQSLQKYAMSIWDYAEFSPVHFISLMPIIFHFNLGADAEQ